MTKPTTNDPHPIARRTLILGEKITIIFGVTTSVIGLTGVIIALLGLIVAINRCRRERGSRSGSGDSSGSDSRSSDSRSIASSRSGSSSDTERAQSIHLGDHSHSYRPPQQPYPPPISSWCQHQQPLQPPAFQLQPVNIQTTCTLEPHKAMAIPCPALAFPIRSVGLTRYSPSAQSRTGLV